MRKRIILVIFGLGLIFPLQAKATVLGEKVEVNKIILPPEISIKVTAQIEGYLFDIEGLTSPFAKVQFFSSQGNINLETLADKQGVFRFSSAQMPLSSGDFCFQAIDTQQQASAPLCFTPPPAYTQTNIRGVILPPTLSLDKGVYLQGEDNAAFGETTPDSPVKVFLFEEENVSFWELIDAFPLLVVRSSPFAAYARIGPGLTIQTSSRGRFSLNLPTYKSTVWRLFVGTQKTQLGENPSPQSNTIQFVALSWWQWWLLKALSCLKKLSFLWKYPLLIILLLVTAIIITVRLIIKRGKKKKRAKAS